MSQATLKDVAAIAKVSYQTVSKVIRGQAQVAPETADRIWQAIDELNYTPNITARNLRLQSSNLVGYSWTSGSNLAWFPIQERFLHSISNAAEKRGFLITVFTHPGRDQFFKPSIYSDLFARKQVDGFILADTCIDDPRIDHLIHSDIPFTSFGRGNDDWDFCWVDIDGFFGIQLVMEHLLSNGHRKIGFITWEKEYLAGQHRRNGYQSALRTAGIQYNPTLVVRGSDSPDAGRSGAAYLLSLPVSERPTALVCASDQLAIGALLAVSQAGYVAGQDIAVTGYDNIPMTRYFVPPLTSVQQPVETAGDLAMNLLLSQIEGHVIPRKGINLKPELVIRESSNFTIKGQNN